MDMYKENTYNGLVNVCNTHINGRFIRTAYNVYVMTRVREYRRKTEEMINGSNKYEILKCEINEVKVV